MKTIQIIINLASILFTLFIFWIIYLANSNSYSFFFETVKSITLGDKIGHFFLFGMLSYLLNITLKFRVFRMKKINLYLGTCFVLVFVSIEEFSQIYISSRTFDIMDLTADILGIITATIATYFSKPFL